ncbi:replication initiator, partial [Streptosporangium sp. NPDC051023]|uniref:replication initiator n=1 Tax=Streptosporangium sp. NPDC051023 TaxID=3155410 RepID=UPI003450B704
AQKVLTQWPRCHHDDVPSPHHENLARPHFSTKSRRYSTTLGKLRAARAAFVRGEEITTGRLPILDEDTVLVISHWEYAGKGLSAGDALLAAALTGTPPASSSGMEGGAR